MKYKITDGNAIESADTLEQAANICEEWYDHMTADAMPTVPAPNLVETSLDDLNDSIRDWQNRIAEAKGEKAWYGHGNYHVSAGDSMGLNLRVREEEI